jgi:hypothetical protein
MEKRDSPFDRAHEPQWYTTERDRWRLRAAMTGLVAFAFAIWSVSEYDRAQRAIRQKEELCRTLAPLKPLADGIGVESLALDTGSPASAIKHAIMSCEND